MNINIGVTMKEYAMLFKALSDENRIKIVQMIQNGETCACTLIEGLDITQPTLSYHMKYLTDSGLIESRKDGNWTRYKLKEHSILLLREFIGGFNPKGNREND
jgi:ArsR family transcriptional regulator